MGANRFEPHTHTAESSKCGRIPAAELVELYHANGYQSLAITDHMHGTFISLLYCFDDWATCVDRFLDGYRRAKVRGDELGISVILAMELRFPANDNDYLVYGIDEAWLYAHPYPYRTTAEEFFRRYSEELLIIHAHPFREENKFARQKGAHGVELVNTHLDHDNYNEDTLAYCKERPDLFRVAGSDTHRKKQEAHAWVDCERPILCAQDYIDTVKSGKYTLGAKLEQNDAVLRAAREYFKE